ncbi:hypothetical protein L0244_12045 [bacterium]|nr:hypothetical protein [bacterium]
MNEEGLIGQAQDPKEKPPDGIHLQFAIHLIKDGEGVGGFRNQIFGAETISGAFLRAEEQVNEFVHLFGKGAKEA